MSSDADITVVVCSYNRADSLRESLESLQTLDTNGAFVYEILVVDNASTDHTADVVNEIRRKADCMVRYVLEEQPGVSFARNRGVKETQTDWVAFFDDDEIAEPYWLHELYTAAKENNVKCVGGCNHLLMAPEDKNRKLKPFVQVIFGCTQEMTEPQFYTRKRTPGAGNMLLNREVFDRVGLFRTDLVEGGEDTDLYHRMRDAGFEAFYTPKALIHHKVPHDRLQPKHLRPAVMRMGEHIARREYTEYSWWLFPFVFFARIGQAFLKHGSGLLLSHLVNDAETHLERQCWWWLGLGYIRGAWRFLTQGEQALSSLDFRAERAIQ